MISEQQGGGDERGRGGGAPGEGMGGERLGTPGGDEQSGYMLRLYIAGATMRSSAAVENIRRICEQHLPGQYELEVVDLYRQPERAREGQVVAAPTLVKCEPQPPAKLIGDMSNESKVLSGLGLPTPDAVERRD